MFHHHVSIMMLHLLCLRTRMPLWNLLIKGDGIVLTESKMYDDSHLRVISIKNKCDPTLSFKSEIDHFLKQALSSGHVNQSEYKYLTNDFPIKPVIYGLAKVHKSKKGVPKCRPIIVLVC